MEASNEFEAGRLHYFVKEWRKVSNDPFVLDIVQHCHLDINVHAIEHLLFAGARICIQQRTTTDYF